MSSAMQAKDEQEELFEKLKSNAKTVKSGRETDSMESSLIGRATSGEAVILLYVDSKQCIVQVSFRDAENFSAFFENETEAAEIIKSETPLTMETQENISRAKKVMKNE